MTIVDAYTYVCIAIEVGQSLKGTDVVRVRTRLKQQYGLPRTLFCDIGSEFASHAMDLWAYQDWVQIDFSRPGKPTRQRFCRELQWNVSRWTLERALVYCPG